MPKAPRLGPRLLVVGVVDNQRGEGIVPSVEHVLVRVRGGIALALRRVGNRSADDGVVEQRASIPRDILLRVDRRQACLNLEVQLVVYVVMIMTQNHQFISVRYQLLSAV